MNGFVNAAQSHSPCPDRADRPSDKPAWRDATDKLGLLDRILNTPRLDHVVSRLRPDLLHRVIQNCGLEDYGEIVALAMPEQLAHVFDLDLWRAPRRAWTSSSTPIEFNPLLICHLNYRIRNLKRS